MGCSDTLQDAQPLYKDTLNKSVKLLCNGYNCPGKYIIEHLNTTTQQYEVIQEGTHHTTVTAPGIYRCWKNCDDDDDDQSPYCYLRVEVILTNLTLMMHFPPAPLNNNYTGSCTASGNPVPQVHVTLGGHNEHCHYTTSVNDTDRYTRTVSLSIKPVTTECRGAVVKCQTKDTEKTMTLNVTGEMTIPNTTDEWTPPYQEDLADIDDEDDFGDGSDHHDNNTVILENNVDDLDEGNSGVDHNKDDPNNEADLDKGNDDLNFNQDPGEDVDDNDNSAIVDNDQDHSQDDTNNTNDRGSGTSSNSSSKLFSFFVTVLWLIIYLV
ncbi:homeobox protein 13-like isoform X2 [Dysidea avara]